MIKTPSFKVFHFDELTSTNDWARALLRRYPEDNIVVSADFQTSGRGQMGHRWESERGENLLYSIGLHLQNMPAGTSFILLQIASLAIYETLKDDILGLTIKWPNDIYIFDMKVSGTLIENKIQRGQILQSILGTGINVNQEKFSPWVPNGVGLYTVYCHPTDCKALLKAILKNFKKLYRAYLNGKAEKIRKQYFNALYRRDGYFPYRDYDHKFKARIVTVEPDGHLVLEDTEGYHHRYGFKEVMFLPVPHPFATI